jgi:hypothetical protein
MTRESQRYLAPASIAQVAKQQRSDRPHEKTGAEYAKRLDQRSGRIFSWKVIASDRNREETVNRKVIPFEDIAGYTCKHNAPFGAMFAHGMPLCAIAI